jgi:hypothetical protein
MPQLKREEKMFNNNFIRKCLLMSVLICVLILIPAGLSASHSVMLGGIPEYSEESLTWCGPATAQMIMDGYPSGSLYVSQEDIWDDVQLLYKVETMWDTDPEGLRDVMQNRNPPSGQWVVFHETDETQLMYWITYWMTKNNYPVAVLLKTASHNGIVGHEEHWVEVRGVVTDLDPTIPGNTTIALQYIWYTDPSPANLGDPAVSPYIAAGAWYSELQPVTKTLSKYNGEHVAIIEPPQIVGKALAPLEVMKGTIISPQEALKEAALWIKENKIYQIETYKDLKNAKPLKPLLVNKEYGGYYLIPYTTTSGPYTTTSVKQNNPVPFSVLINAYKGNFQQVGAFKPVKYMYEQEAIQTALKYLNIKSAKEIEAELVTKIKGQSFHKYFPCWKITLDGNVVHVSQRGRIYSNVLPIEPGTRPPRCKKWSASIHGGVTYPITDFGSRYNSSFMFGVDIDYHFSSKLSAVAFAGFNHFKVKPAFSYLGDTHWWNFSANLKWNFGSTPLRPYVNGGFGIYVPKTGSNKLGYNVGIGINRTLAPALILEVGVDYHHILTDQEDPEFYTGHAGLIFRF